MTVASGSSPQASWRPKCKLRTLHTISDGTGVKESRSTYGASGYEFRGVRSERLTATISFRSWASLCSGVTPCLYLDIT